MFFLFFALVTLEVISQVWHSAHVDRTVILGVMSGYICLGLLGFFLFMSIEIIEPGSIKGISEGVTSMGGRSDILYFSYISLLTIGYGEIVPTSDLSKSASVLLGLLGQFYMVIITAIVVGKFLSQGPSKE
ncbi:MAG: ion channel [Flavobacteriaceae bacterium]